LHGKNNHSNSQIRLTLFFSFVSVNKTRKEEVSMNPIIERIKKILTAPKSEWEVIKGETTSIPDLFTKYAMILAAVPALAQIIGYSIVGVSGFGFHFRYPFGSSFLYAILIYIFGLAGVYVLGIIIDALAPSFGAQKDLNASMKVAVYSYTAAWAAGIFHIIPALAILAGIGGLYSLYLLYIGMQSLKGAPADKQLGYFAVSIIVAIVIYIIVFFVVGAMALGGGLAARATWGGF